MCDNGIVAIFFLTVCLLEKHTEVVSGEVLGEIWFKIFQYHLSNYVLVWDGEIDSKVDRMLIIIR